MAPANRHKSLAVQLMTEVRTRELHPHDPLPSQSEIMERFGVSISTIRQALDTLEREGRIYRINGKGVFLSPLMGLGTILVVHAASEALPMYRYHLSEFLLALNHGVSRGDSMGQPTVVATPVFEDLFLESLASLKSLYPALRGVLFFRTAACHRRCSQALQGIGVPSLFYGDEEAFGEPGVMRGLVYRSRRGIASMLEHLFERGRRNIAFLSWPGSARAVTAREVFEETAPAGAIWHGLECPREEAYEFLISRIRTGQMPYDALLGCDDVMACQALLAAREGGVDVPTDLAVAGINDSPYSELIRPRLTTLEFPLTRDAQVCRDHLLRGGTETLPASDLKLVIREST